MIDPVDPDSHERMLPIEIGQDRHQAIDAEQIRHLDRDVAFHLACIGVTAIRKVLVLLQQRARLLEHVLADARQRHLARRAVKQQHAERRLQAPDRAADAGNAEPVGFGGFREAALFGNRLEYLERFQAIHDTSRFGGFGHDQFMRHAGARQRKKTLGKLKSDMKIREAV
ncbi:hypothetical protein WS75_15985 [Burkholderia sp. FL-7-2-10-S1-D7]|nr:hypothetical protein WS75_15985 [Burkholderia sp. FL-7-2-10-S1-D7]